MRCHAAEPGAVTSLRGLHNPGCSWRTGRSVGGPQGKLPGRREARLYGPDERASVIPRPDQGARAPVRFGRTARYWQNTAVERRLACALRHWARTPRQACLLPGCADRRSAPSLLSRDGEKDTKVRPGIAATGWRSYKENPCPNQKLSSRPSAAQRRASRDLCIPVSPPGFMGPGSAAHHFVLRCARDDNLSLGEVKEECARQRARAV